jgi:hypothetical protein
MTGLVLITMFHSWEEHLGVGVGVGLWSGTEELEDSVHGNSIVSAPFFVYAFHN